MKTSGNAEKKPQEKNTPLCSLHLAATVYSKHIYFSAALFKNANRCNYTCLVYQQLLPVFWRRRTEEDLYFKAFAVGH